MFKILNMKIRGTLKFRLLDTKSEYYYFLVTQTPDNQKNH